MTHTISFTFILLFQMARCYYTMQMSKTIIIITIIIIIMFTIIIIIMFTIIMFYIPLNCLKKSSGDEQVEAVLWLLTCVENSHH